MRMTYLFVPTAGMKQDAFTDVIVAVTLFALTVLAHLIIDVLKKIAQQMPEQLSKISLKISSIATEICPSEHLYTT